MIGDINLTKATPLEKANVVLEKVITHAQNSPAFLEAEGIFRQSGDSAIVDGMYRKVDADPALLQLENEKAFTIVEHNVTGLLKRYILNDKMQWSDEAANILSDELHQKLDERTFEFDFKNVIKKLIEENHLEEAKMLHNTLHMGYLVAAKSDKNKMSPSNMFQTYAPWLAGMAKADDELYMMLTLAAKPVSAQNKDALGLQKNGSPVYSQTFDQTYPQLAEKIAGQHVSIPKRESAVGTSSSATNKNESMPVLFKRASDWLTQKAIPAVKDFFTKKIPSFFRRLTGAKEKAPRAVEMPNKRVVPAELLAAKEQAAMEQAKVPAADVTKWQEAKPSKAVRNDVVMGSEMPPPAMESELVNDAFNAGKAEKREVRPPSITPSKITVEEQSAMKKAKGDALAFFKDLEKKVEKKVSDLRTPKK